MCITVLWSSCPICCYQHSDISAVSYKTRVGIMSIFWCYLDATRYRALHGLSAMVPYPVVGEEFYLQMVMHI